MHCNVTASYLYICDYICITVTSTILYAYSVAAPKPLVDVKQLQMSRSWSSSKCPRQFSNYEKSHMHTHKKVREKALHATKAKRKKHYMANRKNITWQNGQKNITCNMRKNGKLDQQTTGTRGNYSCNACWNLRQSELHRAKGS